MTSSPLFPASSTGEPCCPLLNESTLSESDATKLARLLKSLADPVRLQIVSLIMSSGVDEICSCDIPAAVGKSQPTVSHHLKLLTEAGIIRREQRGKWAWFSVQSDLLRDLGVALGGNCC